MAAAHDPKPRFHIAPPHGWINDPNGPIFYKGYYHMFYQYIETGCTWSWGLMWGHAVSRDLIKWQHLPPALAPTFGGFDGDGCFSGCATLDEEGVPTILYTGVRLRSSSTCGPLPPPECDLGTACIETQCLAYGDPADPKLIHWTKEEMPFLSLPPPNMNLTAWRDPYVIGRPGQDGHQFWTVMVGAGVKEHGGTALVYKSPTLRGGSWSYVGELCRGRGDTGVIWECPVMLHLPRLPPPPSPPTGAPSATQMCQQVQSPLVTLPADASDNLLLLSRSSPIVKPDSVPVAVFMDAAALSPAVLPPPFNIIATPSPAPASPRPPIKPRPASAADALPYMGADEVLSAEQRLADGTTAALLSPRRRAIHVLPQTPMSPLRSPARWNLPALTALPHAPSPPAPRPPGARNPADSIVGTIKSPGSASSTATGPAALNIDSNAPGLIATRQGYAPSASPRLMQLLPRSSGNVICSGNRAPPPYGSLASPRADPRGPAGAISALLPASSPVPPMEHAPRATFIMPPSPPRVKTLPVAIAAASSVADHCAATAAQQSWQCYQTFFCVCPDDCNSMAVYYLGSYNAVGSAFNLDEALGPFPVDLGDIFYAPNALRDPQGRSVLWGWLQEKPRKVGTYDYAGCLSMPRVLYLEVDEQPVSNSGGGGNAGLGRPAVHLVQRPPPEIVNLRLPGSEWVAAGLLLEPGSTLPVPLVSGHHLELELSMMPIPQPLEPLREEGDMAARVRDNVGEWSGYSPGLSQGGAPGIGFSPRRAPRPDTADRRHGGSGGSRCSGVLLHNWQSGAEGSAALLYHWDSGVLEVVFEAMDPATLTFSLAAPGARRVGGPLQRPPARGTPLALRVFLDYSCLEVFTGNGEVLTARVYRGCGPRSNSSSVGYHQRQNVPSPGSSTPPPLYSAGGTAAAGVELVSFGCSTEFLSVGAYEVGSIWEEDV